LNDKSKNLNEFINFKIDQAKEGDFDYFFIEIKQEDDSRVWSRESFSFDDIMAMEFL